MPATLQFVVGAGIACVHGPLAMPFDRLAKRERRASALGSQQCRLYIAPAIEPLPGPAFVGLELRELSLPKSQNIRRHAAQAGDVSNAEIQLIRDLGFFWGSLLR